MFAFDDEIKYKNDGLMKQSFSVTTTTGIKYHLISYYSRGCLNLSNLKQPSLDPMLKDIFIPLGLYPDIENIIEIPKANIYQDSNIQHSRPRLSISDYEANQPFQAQIHTHCHNQNPFLPPPVQLQTHPYAHLNTYLDHNATQNHQLHQQSPIFATHQASAAVSPGINQEPQQLLEYKEEITELPLKDTTTKSILSLDVGILDLRSSPLSTNPSFINAYNLSGNQEYTYLPSVPNTQPHIPPLTTCTNHAFIQLSNQSQQTELHTFAEFSIAKTKNKKLYIDKAIPKTTVSNNINGRVTKTPKSSKFVSITHLKKDPEAFTPCGHHTTIPFFQNQNHEKQMNFDKTTSLPSPQLILTRKPSLLPVSNNDYWPLPSPAKTRSFSSHSENVKWGEDI